MSEVNAKLKRKVKIKVEIKQVKYKLELEGEWYDVVTLAIESLKVYRDQP